MKKTLFVLIFLIVCSFIIVRPVNAVTQTDGDLQVTYEDPLFSSSIIWYPGLHVQKSFTVKNIGTTTHKAQITNANKSQTGNLANHLSFLINEGANTLYGSGNKTMKNFWDNGITNLSDIGPSNSATYDVGITMPANLGNEFQNTKAGFDFVIGFEGTNSQITISNGGGTVAGASTSCNDSKPGNNPSLLSVIPGINSVTLTWFQASDPVSYYLVTYGVSPSSTMYGNPNVGGKGTTSYTVNGLSAGTVYCFQVRAGNGCMPGDLSNSLCTTPSGAVLAQTVAPGFVEGVLGVSSPSARKTETLPQQGEVQGVETKVCSKCIWWQILIGEIITILIYYWIIVKKSLKRNQKILSLIIPLGTYAIYYLLNKSCITSFIFPRQTNLFCKYFLLIDAVVFFTITIIKRYYDDKRVNHT